LALYLSISTLLNNYIT